ncbi:MAG: DUF1929 domain-containing protein [Planctomycetaceae bacterium]|nr:DUF1929 domain-containing protein [Planctomycetaceae bacterium]
MDPDYVHCPPEGGEEHDHGSNFREIAHAALIPVGQYAGHILLWNYDVTSTQTTASFLVNPLVANCGPALTELPQALASNIFCSGHTFLPDGSLVAVGGFPAGTSSHNAAFRFNPRALNGVGSTPPPTPWQPWPSTGSVMTLARYYPTALLLNRRSLLSPTGWHLDGASVMVLGGPKSIVGDLGNALWEFQENALTNWRQVYWPTTADQSYDIVSPANFADDARSDSYPRALQLSNGDIFVAGDVDTAAGQPSTAHGKTWRIRTPTPTRPWELHRGPVMATDRHYGTAVLLHRENQPDRLLVLGGSVAPSVGPLAPTASVQELRPTGDPSFPYDWSNRAPLTQPRVWLNGVVLPTGDVLVTGGASSPSQPVYAPELYRVGSNPGAPVDPTNFSTLMATPPVVAGCPGNSGPTPRLYHHVAVLLPNGKVFIAGGESRHPEPSSHFTAELFEPPYLSHGLPPVIDDAPAQVALASVGNVPTFVLKTSMPIGDTLDRVVLLRPASVTHHFDVDQRYVELELGNSFASVHPELNLVSYTTTVRAPDEMLAPPGWYMLFVVSTKSGTGHRVPSVGEFVRFQ